MVKNIDSNISSNIKLQFPLNNGGQEVGISEGGIEHFTGKLVESLCKEILQNSLDARIGENQVTVEFKLLSIPRSEVPELDELVETIKKCLDYWKGNAKAEKVLKKSLKSLEGEKIQVLRVSDYGTCGLTGATKTRDSNFFDLVKSSGASSKGGLSGGSFGIGKFAPFACSYPRTVFYSTLNQEGEYAFQGVARLVTHKIKGETTQGVGYIGDPNNNMPITEKETIPTNFLRKEVGTDINIIGFSGGDNWKESVIKSSLMSFFESIYEGKLKLIVDGEEISKSNFETLGETHLKDAPEKDYTYDYFKCVVSEEGENKKVFRQEFIYKDKNYGEIELHLLRGRDLKKRIAYLRSTGMKIIDKGNFRTAMKFSGVLKFNGEEINMFIRSLETPSHDKLEVDRHDEPKFAKKLLDELNKFVREKVAEFGKLSEGEEIDIKGLSRFLPDNSKENEILNYSLKNGKIKDITWETYEKKKKKDSDNDFNGVIERVPLSSLEDDGEENKEKNSQDEPNLGISLPSEDQKPKEKNGNDAEEDKVSDREIEVIKEHGKAHLKLSKRKALINDREGKRYKVIIESLEDREVHIKLKARYEDGGSEIAEITKVISSKGENTNIIGKTAALLDLKANKKEIVYVELEEKIYASMEVIVNAK